jgi:DNA-binding response OmpR family regulator
VQDIDILIVDEDASTQGALRQMLESEGCRVQGASTSHEALQQLAARAWTLVIASINLTGFSTALYNTLREVALAPVLELGKTRLRVLFLVPENADAQARSTVEASGLPYASKPFHLHDFLERVSDLLMESGAISEPIRQVRQERGKFAGRGAAPVRRDTARGQTGRRNTGMFADYSDYSMTEEEIAEYEKTEAVERERKKRDRKNLGGAL